MSINLRRTIKVNPSKYYHTNEADWRVQMKRLLRANGFLSSDINDLPTNELEVLVVPFSEGLIRI